MSNCTDPKFQQLAKKYEITQTIHGDVSEEVPVIFAAKEKNNGRKVALKYWPTAAANNEYEMRIVRNEIGLFKKLSEYKSGYYTPIVFDSNTDDKGPVFISMELFETDLRTILLNKRLNEFQVRTVLSKAISCVEYIHSLNITHGDLKPEQFLVNWGDTIMIKLTDFDGSGETGIREELYNLPDTPDINGGSQYFTSPEQYYSGGKHVAEPTDIWALGCIISRVLDNYENGNGKGIIEPYGRYEYAPFLGNPNLNEFQFVENIISPEWSDKDQMLEFLRASRVKHDFANVAPKYRPMFQSVFKWLPNERISASKLSELVKDIFPEQKENETPTKPNDFASSNGQSAFSAIDRNHNSSKQKNEEPKNSRKSSIEKTKSNKGSSKMNGNSNNNKHKQVPQSRPPPTSYNQHQNGTGTGSGAASAKLTPSPNQQKSQSSPPRQDIKFSSSGNQAHYPHQRSPHDILNLGGNQSHNSRHGLTRTIPKLGGQLSYPNEPPTKKLKTCANKNRLFDNPSNNNTQKMPQNNPTGQYSQITSALNNANQQSAHDDMFGEFMGGPATPQQNGSGSHHQSQPSTLDSLFRSTETTQVNNNTQQKKTPQQPSGLSMDPQMNPSFNSTSSGGGHGASNRNRMSPSSTTKTPSKVATKLTDEDKKAMKGINKKRSSITPKIRSRSEMEQNDEY